MSIAKNFVYNSAITVSSYIVGFLVFPYISRVLGVSNIGIVGFVDNVIGYFYMFSVLGLNTVGIREIASQKTKEDTTTVFFQLLSFIFCTLFISLIVFLVVINFVPIFNEYRKFFLIGLCKLLCAPLMIEWLYSGKQDFKYISIRTIFIKVLYVFSVFVFVRQKDDVDIYFGLTSLSVFLNWLINIYTSKKYVNLREIRFSPFVYAKPIMKLGVFAIITSLYSSFNVICLGKVSTIFQVGLYCTAIKLYDVIMNLFRAYTSVVMPQMSQYASNNDNKRFHELSNKSFEVLFSFSIPLSIITFILSPMIIQIIAGVDFLGAAMPMRIVMPILIIAGINQCIGVQVLMPLKKDNVLLATASIAAFVGVVSNLLLDAKLGAVGAAITILLSELTGCIGGLYYSRSRHLISIPARCFLKYIITSIPYFIFYYLLRFFPLSDVLANIMVVLLFCIYFSFQQIFLCKNPIIISYVKRLTNRRSTGIQS